MGLEVYEFSERDWRVRLKEASSHGNLESWLTPPKEIELTLAAARDAIDNIRSLLPDEPEAIETSVPPATREVSFRFRGLEFARWIDGRVYFGLGDDRRLLPGGDLKQALLRDLSLKRSSLASGHARSALSWSARALAGITDPRGSYEARCASRSAVFLFASSSARGGRARHD